MMALSQKHRSSISQNLTPILGEEEAEALLSQFPSHEFDEPVTKQFVRAEVADVRAEIAEVRTEVAELRAEMHAEFGRVGTAVAELRAEMYGRFRAQTVWIASIMTVGMGLAAGIACLGG